MPQGHFVVVLADQDHVFFEYQTAPTSDVVCTMIKGFKGYVQADARAIYHALPSCSRVTPIAGRDIVGDVEAIDATRSPQSYAAAPDRLRGSRGE